MSDREELKLQITGTKDCVKELVKAEKERDEAQKLMRSANREACKAMDTADTATTLLSTMAGALEHDGCTANKNTTEGCQGCKALALFKSWEDK